MRCSVLPVKPALVAMCHLVNFIIITIQCQWFYNNNLCPNLWVLVLVKLPSKPSHHPLSDNLGATGRSGQSPRGTTTQWNEPHSPYREHHRRIWRPPSGGKRTQAVGRDKRNDRRWTIIARTNRTKAQQIGSRAELTHDQSSPLLQAVHRAAKIGTRPRHHNSLDYLAGELVAALAALRRAILDRSRLRD